MKRLNPYLEEGSEKQRKVRNKIKNFVWERRVVQPTHSEQWQWLSSQQASRQSWKDTHKEPKVIEG